MHDLETIIVFVLIAFPFIHQRSHHSLTLPRSRIRDTATVTLKPGDGTTAIKVESSAKPSGLFSRMEKNSEVHGRNNNGPKKHCPAALLAGPDRFWATQCPCGTILLTMYSMMWDYRTRNNVAKLIVKHFNTSVAQHFYPIKITTTWNALPSEVVSSRTVNSFKNSLEKHWAENSPNVRVNW